MVDEGKPEIVDTITNQKRFVRVETDGSEFFIVEMTMSMSEFRELCKGTLESFGYKIVK